MDVGVKMREMIAKLRHFNKFKTNSFGHSGLEDTVILSLWNKCNEMLLKEN